MLQILIIMLILYEELEGRRYNSFNECPIGIKILIDNVCPEFFLNFKSFTKAEIEALGIKSIKDSFSRGQKGNPFLSYDQFNAGVDPADKYRPWYSALLQAVGIQKRT